MSFENIRAALQKKKEVKKTVSSTPFIEAATPKPPTVLEKLAALGNENVKIVTNHENKTPSKKRKRKEIDLDAEIKPLIDAKLQEPVWKSPFYDEKLIPNPPFRLLISGPGTAGKTVLLTNLLVKKHFYRDYFTKFVIISPNIYNREWEYVLQVLGHKAIAIDDYDPQWEAKLMMLYEEQRKIVQEDGPSLAPRILIVWDDPVDNRYIANSKFLQLVFTRGRHQNFSGIYSAQFYYSLPLKDRKQLTNVFQFGTPNEKEIHFITQEMGHRKLTKHQFEQLFEEATKGDHKFLHINLQAHPDQRFRRGFQYIYEINGNPAKRAKTDTAPLILHLEKK